jgi:hypothetical protein
MLVSKEGNVSTMGWEDKFPALQRYRVIHSEHFEEDKDGDIVLFEDVLKFLQGLTQEDF